MQEKPLLAPRRVLLCLLLMGGLLVPLPAVSLTGDLTNDPAGVIKKYLKLDKQGARLTAESYEAVKPYVAWDEEPVWGHLVVILEFSVNDDVTHWDIINSTETVIPVTFQVLGVVHWKTATFLPEPREEVRFIRIRAVDNHWRMVDPMLPPHVGRQRLLDFVKHALLQEDQEAHAAVLRKLRDDLRKAGQS